MLSRSLSRRALVKKYMPLLVTGLFVIPALLLGFSSKAMAGPCDPPIANPVVCENSKPGNAPSEWDISGAGDLSIQGFATEISVNKGETVHFKVNTDARDYRIDIYRLGYYQGLGARLVATVTPSVSLPQAQPACIDDTTSKFTDCGNWVESASWAVPGDAASGVYVAKLVRSDTGGASHIIFVVRDDSSVSDILFKTSDTTWQAYNSYGLSYIEYPDYGYPTQKAAKGSYNRPILTRSHGDGLGSYNFFFHAEYPMVRWLEANGYNVSYFTSVDTDRRGSLLLNHRVFLSVGHDEYWSGAERANVEAARAAGVHLAFFSGNEIYRKIRWESSIDGSGTAYRTMVCYNESNADAPVDPADPPTWTGTWRDARFSPPADGGRPENALSGTLFTVSEGPDALGIPLQVPEANGKTRFWRNTAVATLPSGQTATLGDQIVGYEFDEDIDNGVRPAGLIQLSSTTTPVVGKLLDDNIDRGQDVYLPGTATHVMTLYRASSGALVFSAATVQWSWGLDGQHDNGNSAPDASIQQATVNLLADMGTQPGTLAAGLAAATASTDTVQPTSVITSPAAGSTVQVGTQVTITGTAADTGGVVGAVEVSLDGGQTWHPAVGRANWTYTWTPISTGSVTIKSRAVDDSGNLETPGSGVSITVQASSLGAGIWNRAATPTILSDSDTGAVELGVRFRSEVDGYITGLLFYKAAANTGTHVGNLWSGTGTLLASVTFAGETASGWQYQGLTTPVAITANTTYVASYHTNVGRYSADTAYFAVSGFDNPPLRALRDGEDGGNGVYRYGSASAFPNQSYISTNYWVDVAFQASLAPDTTPPTVASVSPASGATDVSTVAAVTVAFSEAMSSSTITTNTFALRDSSNSLVPATISYNGITKTATLTPSVPLATSTTYAATIKGGTGGVTDSAGNALQADYTWSFTTGAQATTTYSIWSQAATPAILSDSDTGAVELGVKFRSQVDGYVTGLFFYKAPANTGTHVGNLWSSTGTLLASVTFTNETASGWQYQALPTPVAVTANTTYVASYHTNGGRYSADSAYFASAGHDNPPLRALANGEDGSNGVYRYGSNSAFPTQAWNSTNYWVDVAFQTSLAPDTTPPTMTSVTPASGATGVSTGTTVTATFSEAMSAGTITTGTFTLRDASNNLVAATVSYNGTTNVATLTPSASLTGAATYTATVHGGTGGVADLAGNPLQANFSWSFTTAGQPPDTTPPTITVVSPVNGAIGVSTATTVTAAFSEAMNASTITGSTFTLRDSSNNLLGATVTYNSSTRTATLTPSSSLTVSSTYSATVQGGTSGVKDLAGNPLQSDLNWSFTTASQTGDTTPPTVTAVSPVNGATGVSTGTTVTATFSEAINAATITTTTFTLSDFLNNLLPASVSYNSTTRTATLTPTDPVAPASTYTAAILGGTVGVKDLAGNPLAGNFVWSFSTAVSDPAQGPGGPILVVGTSSNPFSRYYAEILRAEGFNAFSVLDLSAVNATVLQQYDVVILGQMALTSAQVTMFGNWVTGGGNLIAMRPDSQLASLLGLTPTGSTLTEGYLLVNTSTSPGSGIVGETIQFHGTADRYTLGSAANVATLYANATTATSNPAVTLRSVGTNGGQAAAFTYDLARSIVYTRQGNPAWAGQERDGITVIRSDDLFYPDWIDLTKVAIPQADEQQRLLANLIINMSSDRKPLPRFWYFPRGLEAVVIMTSDNHGNGQNAAARFDTYLADSPQGCSVDDWECIRSTAYIYPDGSLTAAQAAAYTAEGFEVAEHVTTYCADYTPSSLESDFAGQLSTFAELYPGLPAPATNRTHCVPWSDYATQPQVELNHGIGLDANYYYYGPSNWIADRPGFFTGSGMPMRFATSTGQLIDVYQVVTQMTDESEQSYPFTIDSLLDKAIGPEGYYGAFCANMHSDSAASSGSDAIIASAQERGIPVISSRQMLDWLDGRNNSSLGSFSWNGSVLTFSVRLAQGANGLEVLVPVTAGRQITNITHNGSSVGYALQTVKGIQYASFPAALGGYQVTFSADTTPPSVILVSPPDGATGVSTGTAVTATFSEGMNPATVTAATFTLSSPSTTVPATVNYDANTNMATLTPSAPLAASTLYTATVKGGTGGVADVAGNPLQSDFTWSFTTAAATTTSSIWSRSATPAILSDSDTNAVELGVKFRSQVNGYVTGLFFYKAATNTGTHVGNLWSSTGTLLASVTFTNETPSGWQYQALTTPVAIAANTTYVASYHTNVGRYSADSGYFASSGHDNSPLRALANGEDGPNGVYRYGSSSAFPNQSYNSTNYWVDVEFQQ